MQGASVMSEEKSPVRRTIGADGIAGAVVRGAAPSRATYQSSAVACAALLAGVLVGVVLVADAISGPALAQAAGGGRRRWRWDPGWRCRW
jgi:hypothetical protein